MIIKVNKISAKKIVIRYLFIIGLLFNLALIVFGFFSARSIVHSGYPLPIYAEKVLQNIEVNYPSIDKVLRLPLSIVSSWQTDVEYNYVIDATNWQGVGAKTGNTDISDLELKTVYVSSNKSLLTAIKHAEAGVTIQLLPGVYELNLPRITLNSGGTSAAPISLIAASLGKVKLKIRGEGFVVNKPYWRFKNLHIIGTCIQHSRCEHAFHIVGNGHDVILENNIMQDFNAAIKVNGIGDIFPDNGLVLNNTIFNTSVRKTANPVTPIDLMHADNWRVTSNFIFDFIKGSGNKVSYGAFFKGGSRRGEFSKNLIICKANLKSNSIAIGLSLGGGGSPESWHRNKKAYEHDKGSIRNNIIMNCPNDVGIYLNRAKNSQVINNILFNTVGIDIRFKESDGFIARNIISGRIKKRNSAQAELSNNIVLKRSFFTAEEPLGELFVAPANGDFSWKNKKMVIEKRKNIDSDFSGFCDSSSKYEYLGAFSRDVFCRDKMNLENPNRQRKGKLLNEKNTL